jgi:hypothetical protein
MFFKPILNYINNIILDYSKSTNEFISDEGIEILSDSNKTRKLNIMIDDYEKTNEWNFKLLNENDKVDYLNHFLNLLYKYNSDNDYSINKVNILFFFMLNKNPKLFNTFNEFYCLPYAPIEKDIYYHLKNQESLNFNIDRFSLKYKRASNEIDDDISKEINYAFDELIKTGLIDKSLSYLVDLTFEHESTFDAMIKAKRKNLLAYKININSLINEQKFFSL